MASTIAGLEVHLEPATVSVVEAASAAVARLELRAEVLGGLGDLLVRSEAVATSKIERVYADLDDVARASVGAKASQSATRTLAAGRALQALADSTQDGSPLTEEAILDAHHRLLVGDPLEDAWAGRYRKQQNWIGGSDHTPLGAVHVPPPYESVPPLMADLVEFANREDLSGLAQAAVVHAQFEAVHPFTDGNGRVGRGLIGAVLRRRGLTRSVTVPAAAAMLADVDTYFERLKGYREGDADSMVAYLAAATVQACAAAEVSAARFAEMPARWLDAVRPRTGSAAHRMIGGLLRVHVLDAERAGQLTGATPARTYAAIQRLVEAGVLHELTRGARNRIWVASDVVTELKALEGRIGLRSTPGERWR